MFGFNEGGADCPPKPSFFSHGFAFLSCFNEGGADCPPKRHGGTGSLPTPPCFNEGGADCPPKQAKKIGVCHVGLELQ